MGLNATFLLNVLLVPIVDRWLLWISPTHKMMQEMNAAERDALNTEVKSYSTMIQGAGCERCPWDNLAYNSRCCCNYRTSQRGLYWKASGHNALHLQS